MDDLDRIIAEMRMFSDAHVFASRARVSAWADRLAALAGAAPVAWVTPPELQELIDTGECSMFATKEREWANEIPLYAGPHAPTNTREVTDADVSRACAEYESEHWLDGYDAMRAALVTFAEGRGHG